MNVAIRTEALTRRLEGEVPVTLVHDATLDIARGEFVVITGPSGSGKSSLLYLLGLLDRPSAGEIWINGEAMSPHDEEKRADIRLADLGFVFQFHFLLPEFSALENVTLPMHRLGRLTAAEADARGLELLESVGLADQAHKLPKQLSGGQSQRVAIARALANNPSIIFADEPTGSLDTASSANVQNILMDLARTHGRTVIVVTHDRGFADKADRVVRIVDGRLAEG